PDGCVRDGQTGDGDRAETRAQDAVEMEDERRLACTVRPEECDPLPRVDVQLDAEERLVAVRVGERHSLELDDGHTHGSLPMGSRTAMSSTRAARTGTTATVPHSRADADACCIGIRPV